MLGAITSGTLDLGVVFTTPEPTLDTTGLDLSPFYEEQFVLIVPPDSPLSNRTRVSAVELRGRPMITFSPLSRIRQFIDSQLNAGGVRVKIVMELENEEAIERMVPSVSEAPSLLADLRSPKDSPSWNWKALTCT